MFIPFRSFVADERAEFGARRDGFVFDAALAPDTPVYAIGDLHGRADLLAPMINRIDDDITAHGGPAKIVFLGDYIDRGHSSAVTLGALWRLETAEDAVVCLRGRHERMLTDFLDAPAAAGPRWLRHGGLRTLESFGVGGICTLSSPAALAAAARALAAAMPPGLEDWLRARPASFRSGNLLCAHAGADPDLPVAAQPEAALIDGHPRFAEADRVDGVWVAHGCETVAMPRAARGRIATDTGAWFSGRLTAAAIRPGEPVRFIEARGLPIATTRHGC